MTRVQLTRVYRFCAGHRLYNADQDDAWNFAVFGKCSLPDGHGHNFRMEVTVEGSPDPKTGFVIPLECLDEIVRRTVIDPLDHRSLNVELQALGVRVPTTETLAQYVWRAIAPALPARISLAAIRLNETENNVFDYFGE
jgi:6-pyruvoyltetrahydropterin/6-carboxytetrahydropterin synthase